MILSPIDPEDLFWQQIQDRPGDPIPRLLYADWCDENDRPNMAEVQRWLAATGLRAAHHNGSWIWMWYRAADHPTDWCRLPLRLFNSIRNAPHSRWPRPMGMIPVGEECRLFASQRESEVALEAAWEHATSRRRLFMRFRPDYAPRESLRYKTVSPGDWETARPRGRFERMSALLLNLFAVAGLAGLVALFISLYLQVRDILG
jgi:uncharacterized protein (TIGR02996 family)